MGNAASHSRRHRFHYQQQQQQQQQQQMATNQYVFAAPSVPNYPNPNLPYNQYPPGYYPPLPIPFPQGYHRYPPGSSATGAAPISPVVEYQKAVTIRNDVNIKKDSIRVEEDPEIPGKFLICFTFDAISAGSITVVFFAKEGEDCNLIATKENVLKPVTVSFEQGLGQKFRQPSGTGINFSMFQETELNNENDEGVYPLVLKAEAFPSRTEQSDTNSTGNSQITLAVFDNKEKSDYLVQVRKQILWVNGMRYELQEIYGIGNSVDVEPDGNDTGKDCVICMSEPRDTTVLPCRHMCMCSVCAKALQFRSNRCPICRQPIDRLLEIYVDNGTED